ncbi:MAG: hypothetical protein ISR50_00010 [Alphaproteobacteria bacterium]|nr:hypothetical protein [Alphaproteobacteria bacterium]
MKDMTPILLSACETCLSGMWKTQHGQVVADDVCDRIEQLTQSILTEIVTSKDGWNILYIDPGDGRYWELVRLESESHGGGAPTLRNLSCQQAAQMYEF